MTREHAKALLPLITDYAEGKTIQTADHGKNNWRDAEDPSFDSLPRMDYRIKPEPKLVPMTSDDFPPVFWIRHNGDNKAVLITCVYNDGTICWGVGNSLSPRNFESCKWSTDRKTWHSLMKEATE